METLVLVAIYVAVIPTPVMASIAAACAVVALAAIGKAERLDGRVLTRWPGAAGLLATTVVAAFALSYPLLALAGIAVIGAVAAMGLNEFGYPRATFAVVIWSTACFVGAAWLAARRFIDSLNLFI